MAASSERNRHLTGSDTAGSISSLSNELIVEIARLNDRNFSLIPLGGPDGKRPTILFKGRSRIPVRVILDRMLAKSSATFGIRLEGMLVVDVDTDTEKAREYVRKHFGESTVQVRTKRGVHHYFRYRGPTPSSVRLPEIAIDFKCGQNQFVLAAGSTRPDGTRYVAAIGCLRDVGSLPVFVDRIPSTQNVKDWRDNKHEKGSRHRAILAAAIEYAPCEDSQFDLLENLLRFRDLETEDPGSVPDVEVEDIAKWAWERRCSNELYSGRNSALKIRRNIMDRLLGRRHGCDALALCIVLQANHGHVPGKRFPIVPEAMRKAGLIPLCRNRLLRARDTLIEEGLLIPGQQAGFDRAKLYQLSIGERPMH